MRVVWTSLAVAVAGFAGPALLAPALAHADASHAVVGTVLDARTGEPVVGATVSITDGNLAIDALTDDHGSFEASLAATVAPVVIVADGYEPLIGVLRGNELTFRLSRGSQELIQVEATAPVVAETPNDTLDRQTLADTPAGGNDPLRALQTLPSMARIPFGMGGLSLRGSSPRDANVFLDGIEVPIFYHFGGLASFVPMGYLDDVTLEPGGYGAEFGRGQSGIVTMRSRTGRHDRWRAGGELSLIHAAALAEGPGVGGGSWTIGVRRSYFGALLEAADLDLTLKPTYLDNQVRWESRTGRWMVELFGSDDNLSLLHDPNDTSEGGIDTSNVKSLDYTSAFERLGVRYQRTVDGVAYTVTPSIGVDYIDALANHKNVDKGSTRTSIPMALRAQARQSLWGGDVGFGFDLASTYHSIHLSNAPPPNPAMPEEIDGIVDRSDERLETNAGSWIEGLWQLSGGQLSIRPGMRVEYLGLAEQIAFDPRLAVATRLDPKTTVTETIGIYHQPPSVLDLDPAFGDRRMKASWARQAEITIERSLAAGVRLEVTAYQHDLHDLAVDVVTGATPISDNGSEQAGGLYAISRELVEDQFGSYTYRESVGHGYSRGIELMLHKDLGRFRGWIAYTYARSYRTGDPRVDTTLYPYVLDQPHSLALTGSYQRGAWKLGGRFRMASGNPYTPVADRVFDPDDDAWTPVDGPILSERFPMFMQLDLRVDRLWKRRWGTLHLYLDVQNVSNRENAEGIVYAEDYSSHSYTKGLPVFPSLGLELEPPPPRRLAR